MTNPLARLTVWCEAAREIPSSVSFLSGWAKLHDCEETDIRQILISFSDFSNLLDEAEHAIKQLDVPELGIYLIDVEYLRNIANNLNFQREWATVHKFIDPSNIRSLKKTRDLVSAISAEQNLSITEYLDILNKINDLEIDIIQGNFSGHFRDSLLKICRDFKHVLHNARYYGSKNIDESLTYTYGVLYRNRSIVKENKDSTVLTKLKEILEFLSNLYSTVQGGNALASTIKDLLT